MSQRHYRRINWLRMAAFFFTFLCSLNAYCRPDMSPLGPNIADKGSSFYHFSIRTFASADGQRHYKVWTGVPDKAPPPSGYPVLYLLDGNAVMDRLSDALLKQLAAQNPPVVVAIGYQTDKPFDLAARSYDYTPPVMENSEGDGLDRRGWKGGGSAVFQQLLEKNIAPLAEKGLRIDASQRGIWGHSLGGIFALNAYLSSSFFTSYYATSPTLNRKYVGLLTQLAAINKPDFCAKRLFFIEGDGAPGKNPQAPAPDIQNKVRATLALLHTEGVPVAYWSHPELSHGQTFNAGFQQALLHIATPDSAKALASCQR